MIEIQAAQGSPEWFAARLGHATASRFCDILATIKSGESASRRNYRMQLLCERLTGYGANTYCSPEMQWGTEHEPQAIKAYEWLHDVEVAPAGFCRHDTLMAGASPDGWFGKDGCIEVKCPNTATHIDILLAGKMPDKYLPQVQGQIWITGREWCDFLSFDPRLPQHLQLFQQRICRDEKYIRMLGSEVGKFLDELTELQQKLGEK